MGLREKVALLVIVVILRTSHTESKPQSLKTNPFERYINNAENKKNTANNVFKTSKFSAKSNVHPEDFTNPSVCKAFNFPEVGFPSDTSYKNTLAFNPGSKPSESSVLLNNLRKEARRKRKSNRKANKDIVPNKQTEIEQMSTPFYTTEIGGFPEVEYPLSAMDTWTPKYWNTLPYNTDDPYLKTDEYIYRSEFNTEQKNAVTDIKPPSMKDNKGLFAVVRNPKEHKNKKVTMINTNDSIKSKIIESLNIEVSMKENNDSHRATDTSSLAPKVRNKSKKPNKVPVSQRKPNLDRKIQSKSSKTRSQFKSHPNKTQNKNKSECSMNSTCFVDTTNKTVDNLPSSVVPAAAISDNSIPFSPSTHQSNDSSFSYESILLSEECPSDVICKSPSVVSNTILSKITQDPTIKTTGLVENKDIFNTKNNSQSSVASQDSENITQLENQTNLYGSMTEPVMQNENNANVTKNLTESLALQSAILKPIEIDSKVSTIYNTVEILFETVSAVNATHDVISEQTEGNTEHHLTISHNTTDKIKSTFENNTDTSHEALEPPESSSADCLVGSLLTDTITKESLSDPGKSINSKINSKTDLLKSQLETLSLSELRDLAETILARIDPVSKEYIVLEPSIDNNNNLANSISENRQPLPTKYSKELDQNDYTINSDPNSLLTEYIILLPDLITKDQLKEKTPTDGEVILPVEVVNRNTIASDDHVLPSLAEIIQTEKISNLRVLSKTSYPKLSSFSSQINESIDNRELDDYVGPLLSPRVMSDLSTLYDLVQSILTQVEIIPKNNLSDNYSNKIATGSEFVIYDSTKSNKLSDKLATVLNDHVTSSDSKNNENDQYDQWLSNYLEANVDSCLPDDYTTRSIIEIIQNQTTPIIDIEQNQSNHDEKKENSHLTNLYSPLSPTNQCSIFDHPENIKTKITENNNLNNSDSSLACNDIFNKISNDTKILWELGLTYNDSSINGSAIDNFSSSPIHFKVGLSILKKLIESVEQIDIQDLKMLTDFPNIKPTDKIVDEISKILNTNYKTDMFNPDKTLEIFSDILRSDNLYSDLAETIPNVPDPNITLDKLHQRVIKDTFENDEKLDIYNSNMKMEMSGDNVTSNILSLEILPDIVTDNTDAMLEIVDLNVMPGNDDTNVLSHTGNHTTAPDTLSTHVKPVITDSNLTENIDVLQSIHNTNSFSFIPDELLNIAKTYTLSITSETDNVTDIPDIVTFSDLSVTDALPGMPDTEHLSNIYGTVTVLHTDTIPLPEKIATSTLPVIFETDALPVNVETDTLKDMPNIVMLSYTNGADILSDTVDTVVSLDTPSIGLNPEIANTSVLLNVLEKDALLDMSDTGELLDSFSAVALLDMPSELSEITNTVAFQEKLDTGKIPNILDEDFLPHYLDIKFSHISDNTDTSAVSEIPDPDMMTDIFDTSSLSGIPKTTLSKMPDYIIATPEPERVMLSDIPDIDIKIGMPSSDTFSDLLDTDANLEISELQYIKLNTTIIPDISSTDKLSKINGTNTLQDKPGTDKMLGICDTDALLELAVTNYTLDTTALSDIPDSDALAEISGNVCAIPEIPTTVLLPDIPDIDEKPEFLSTEGLPEMPTIVNINALPYETHIGKLPEIFDIGALADTSNCSDLPDVSDSAALSDNSDTDILPEIPDEVILSKILPFITTVTHMPDMRATPDTSSTKVFPEISDITALQEMRSIDKVTETTDRNTSPDLPDTCDISVISDSTTLSDIPNTCKLLAISDSAAFLDILDTDKPAEMPDKIMLPDIDVKSDMPNTDILHNLHELALPEIPAKVALLDVPDKDVKLEFQNTDALPNLPDIGTLLDMLETNELPKISDTVILIDVPSIDKLSVMINTNALQDEPDTDKMRNISDTDALADLPIYKELPDTTDAAYLPDISEINSLPKMTATVTPTFDTETAMLPDRLLDTDVKPDMPNTGVLTKRSDIEIPNMDKVPGTIIRKALQDETFTDTLPDNFDTEALLDLSGTDELPDISDATVTLIDKSDNALLDKTDIDSLPDIPYNITLLDIPNTVAIPDVSNPYVFPGALLALLI